MVKSWNNIQEKNAKFSEQNPSIEIKVKIMFIKI